MTALIVLGIIFLAVLVLMLAGLWKTFKKAGVAGWKSLIPIYNTYQILKIGGLSGKWVLVYFIPLIPAAISLFSSIANAQAGTSSGGGDLAEAFSLLQDGGLFAVIPVLFGLLVYLLMVGIFQLVTVVSVVMTYCLARSFGKSLGFTFGLTVLPFIFLPILGFGNAEYRGPVAHPNMVEKGSGAHIGSSEPRAGQEADQDRSNEKNGDPFVS